MDSLAQKPLFLYGLLFLLSACNQGGGGKRGSALPEESYCSEVRSITNGVTISGTSYYQYFKTKYPEGLYTDAGNTPFLKPIRRAEVRVKDSQGEIVQCGQTDNSGNFLITIPKPTMVSSFTFEVGSRGYGEEVRASVVDKAKTKTVYRISVNKLVGPTDTSIILDSMVAPARVLENGLYRHLEGGAFFIFDQILNVNEYLKDQLQSAFCNGICTSFTVAPKVTLFWAAGFNPASYFNQSDGLSFYDASGSIDPVRGVYILGGSNGDFDNSDTDHFDACTVIHEYGHFLEANYWPSDSPGGYHNGRQTIDPRLAFSEGLAYFLYAAVSGESSCIDSFGSPDRPSQGASSPRIAYYLDYENELVRDQIEEKTDVGEGIYREVSVARSLFDFLDSNADLTFAGSGVATANETAELPFAYLWSALTDTTDGLMKANLHFISMGDFNQSLSAIISRKGDLTSERNGFESARLGEFQTKDRTQYAQQVQVTSGGSCDRIIKPAIRYMRDEAGQLLTSLDYLDLFASADFFSFYHSGGTLSLKLNYTMLVGGTNSPDLDLYVFKEDHSISSSDDVVASSARHHHSTTSIPIETPTGEELISKNLPAGLYMILVLADSSDLAIGDPTQYSLTSLVSNSTWSPLCNVQ